MEITELHLKFYRQKKCNPSFAKKIKKFNDIPVRIDDLINSQNKKKRTPKDLDLDNAISLLKLVRINQKNAIERGYPYNGEARTLKEYMEKCDCSKRRKYYIRWVKKLNSIAKENKK